MIEILLFFGPLLCCSLDFSEAAAEAQANLLCCCSSLLTKLYWSRENSVDDKERRRLLGRRLGAFLTRHFTFFFRQMTIILFRFSTFLLLEIFCHSFSWFFFLQWVLFRLKSLKSIDCSNFGRETLLSRRVVQTEAIKTSLTVLPDFKMLIFGSHWKEEETKKREWYPTIVVLVEFFFFKLCDLVQLCSSLLWKLRVFFFWHSQ